MDDRVPLEVAARITELSNIIVEDSMAMLLLESQRFGCVLNEDEVQAATAGCFMASGLTVQTLNERGWLNSTKMAADLLAEGT